MFNQIIPEKPDEQPSILRGENLTLKTCESADWGPANDKDPQWVEHQKQFVKVSNLYHFYFFMFKSQTGRRDPSFYVLGIL